MGLFSIRSAMSLACSFDNQAIAHRPKNAPFQSEVFDTPLSLTASVDLRFRAIEASDEPLATTLS